MSDQDKTINPMNKDQLMEALKLALNNIQKIEEYSGELEAKKKAIISDETEIAKYKNELQQHSSEIQKYNQKIEKIKTTIENHSKKIESLLPSATSAGLASSYKEAGDRFGFWKSSIYFLGFITSLGALVWGFYEHLLGTNNLGFMNLINRVVVGFPLIWIAWFCQRSLSQIMRLREEYNHKQRIMSVYEGFNKYVKELSGSDAIKLERDLANQVIQAVSKNPAETLGRSTTLLDKVGGVLSRNSENKES